MSTFPRRPFVVPERILAPRVSRARAQGRDPHGARLAGLGETYLDSALRQATRRRRDD